MELRRQDQLLLAENPAQLEVAGARANAMAGIGVKVEEVPPILLREFPQLRPDLAGGFLLRDAWALEPTAATAAFAGACRELGVRVQTGVRATQVAVRSGKAVGVVSDAGLIACDAIVLATGPWLPELLRGAPVSGGRGWLMRTGRLDFDLPWIVEEMSWPDQDELGRAARPPRLSEVAASAHDEPVAEAFVLAPQPAGDALLGTSLSASLIYALEGAGMPGRLARRALAVAPGLSQVSLVAAWSAIRPMTPDGMPIVGATLLDNLYVHGGHGSIGMMTAPATAGWLAELVCDGRLPQELVRLAPERFGSAEKT
jgi:glycine/D-amino acid oxidase-like deaminating enzyme